MSRTPNSSTAGLSSGQQRGREVLVGGIVFLVVGVALTGSLLIRIARWAAPAFSPGWNEVPAAIEVPPERVMQLTRRQISPGQLLHEIRQGHYDAPLQPSRTERILADLERDYPRAARGPQWNAPPNADPLTEDETAGPQPEPPAALSAPAVVGVESPPDLPPPAMPRPVADPPNEGLISAAAFSAGPPAAVQLVQHESSSGAGRSTGFTFPESPASQSRFAPARPEDQALPAGQAAPQNNVDTDELVAGNDAASGGRDASAPICFDENTAADEGFKPPFPGFGPVIEPTLVPPPQPEPASLPLSESPAQPVAPGLPPAMAADADSLPGPAAMGATTLPDAVTDSPAWPRREPVRPGDSFWTIAQRVYGDGQFFRALFEANRSRIPDYNQLQSGTKLLCPSPAELRRRWPGLYPIVNSGADGARPEDGIPQAGSDQPAGTFRTVAGDTLFDIARRELGQASRFAELLELNRSQLPPGTGPMDDLPAGLLLRLPR